MRKFITILSAALCLFSSCTKYGPQGPEGPMGPKGDPGSANFSTVILNVPANAWGYSNQADNNYFFATVDVPEITEEIFDSGMISVYRTYNFDKPNASQVVLPYVNLCEEFDGNTVFYYTETVYYEYGIGWINIYYMVSDFLYETDYDYAPVAMQFRLNISY